MSLQDRYSAALRLYFEREGAVQDLEDLFSKVTVNPSFKSLPLRVRLSIVEAAIEEEEE